MYDFGISIEYIEVLSLIKANNIKSISEFDYPEKLTKDAKIINYAASLGKYEIVKFLHTKGAVLDHIGFMAACLSLNSECIMYYMQNMPEHRYSMPHILGINHRDHNEYFRYFGHDKIKLLTCKQFIEYYEKYYSINDGDYNNIHNYVSGVMFYYNKHILKLLEPSMLQIHDSVSNKSPTQTVDIDFCDEDSLERVKEELEKITQQSKVRETQLLEEIANQDQIILQMSDKIIKLEKLLNKKMQIIQKYHNMRVQVPDR